MSKVKEYYDSLSRYLCYLLRHEPEGLHIDQYGYVLVKDLIEHVNTCSKFRMDEKMLRDIVRHDEKQRYTVKDSFEGKIIKCNQGHSIPWIKMELNTNITPPDELYHGTTDHAYTLIYRSGAIKRMNRNAIHLTADVHMAWKSAKRWKSETSIVLVIDAKQMIKDGYKFGVTENGVWCIVDDWMRDGEIPTSYIRGIKRREKPTCKDIEISIDESYLDPDSARLTCYVIDDNNELLWYRRTISTLCSNLSIEFGDTIGISLKALINYLEGFLYLTEDNKKDIAKQLKDAYEKWEKERDRNELDKM